MREPRCGHFWFVSSFLAYKYTALTQSFVLHRGLHVSLIKFIPSQPSGSILQREVQHSRILRSAHIVHFICSLWVSEQRAIISFLHGITSLDIGTQLRLIFVFEVLTTTSKLSEVMFYWPQLYPYFISCVYFLRKKFTHSSFCLTTGPQPLPVSSRFLKIVQYLLTSFCLSSRHSYPPFYLSFNSVF